MQMGNAHATLDRRSLLAALDRTEFAADFAMLYRDYGPTALPVE